MTLVASSPGHHPPASAPPSVPGGPCGLLPVPLWSRRLYWVRQLSFLSVPSVTL